MSEIVPPTVTPPLTLISVPRLTVLLAPPPLADLPLGAKLDVTVQQLLSNGQTQFSSSLGDITIATGRVPLKPGDNLLLQIMTGGARPTVKLTLPTGQPLTPQPGGPANAATQTPQGPASVTTSAPGIRIGATVTGTLLQPITLNAASIVVPNVQPTLQGGTLGAIPQASTTPGAAATGQPTATVPTTPGGSATPSVQQPGATGQQPSSAATPGTNVFPGGSQIALKITGLQVPETGTSSTSPTVAAGTSISLAPGASLNGTVTGQQSLTHLLVQTPAGTIALPTRDPLPPGTQIQFEIVRLTPTTPPSTLGQSANASHGLLPTEDTWPALDETLSTLRDAAPGAQTHVLQTSLPRADAQLTTNMLFFIAALRGGDIRSWLGDGPIRILERIRPDLAGRLRDDLGQMTRITDDPASGEWRLFAMPFLNDGDLERVRLLMRDDAPEDDDENGKGGSRFVIDLNLSRLGHIQLDGMVGNEGKRLDLVVRSDDPMTDRMRQDIRFLYTDALSITGIDGSVGFQSKPANFVSVGRDTGGSASPGGGVVV